MQDPQQDARETSNALPTLLLLAVLASFAGCGIAWAAGLRFLGLTAGTTVAATAAVAMVAVLGVVAGALVWRRRSGAASILLQQAILALALALAPLVYLPVRAVYLFLWPLLGGSPVGEFLTRSLLAAGLLLLPAAALGSVVASLVATIGHEARDAAQWPGLLLCLAGAGFGLGLAFGGLVLLPSIGLVGSWCIAMAVAGLGASVTFVTARAGSGIAVPQGAAAGGAAGGNGATVGAAGVAAWHHLAALLVGFFLAAAFLG